MTEQEFFITATTLVACLLSVLSMTVLSMLSFRQADGSPIDRFVDRHIHASIPYALVMTVLTFVFPVLSVLLLTRLATPLLLALFA